jgi:hypothetical protein
LNQFYDKTSKSCASLNIHTGLNEIRGQEKACEVLKKFGTYREKVRPTNSLMALANEATAIRRFDPVTVETVERRTDRGSRFKGRQTAGHGERDTRVNNHELRSHHSRAREKPARLEAC